MVVFKFQPHLDKLCANDRAVCQTVSQPCQKATDCQYDTIIRPSVKCELSLQNTINIFWHSTLLDNQKTAFSRPLLLFGSSKTTFLAFICRILMPNMRQIGGQYDADYNPI